ncbi:MAG: RluA family pseudouridine synthase [Chlamydiales bacterium]
MNENFNENILITAEEEGQRLDKILAHRYQGHYSRTYFQSLIANHLILINGEPVKKRTKLQEGDEVEIEFVINEEADIVPENIPLDIIYEDDDLLAINKPVGMVVHPAIGNWKGTFVNALLYHCKELKSQESLRPGIVHRLDKDTTGLLLAAKNSETQQKLIESFASRQMKKEYIAICVGNPGEGIIQAPIGRNPRHRQKMAVVEEKGRDAETIQTLHYSQGISIVKAAPKTGRTHQIRVHLKFRGSPVLGDVLYGSTHANRYYHAHRQLLHAYSLEFTHPRTSETLRLIAPIPEDIMSYIPKHLEFS